MRVHNRVPSSRHLAPASWHTSYPTAVFFSNPDPVHLAIPFSWSSLVLSLVTAIYKKTNFKEFNNDLIIMIIPYSPSQESYIPHPTRQKLLIPSFLLSLLCTLRRIWIEEYLFPFCRNPKNFQICITGKEAVVPPNQNEMI